MKFWRDGFLGAAEEAEVMTVLSGLAESWTEVEPSDDIRDITKRLLQNYPLRAADSLQLAAAIVWSDKTPKGNNFICLDERLREAAVKEGFTVLPTRR